MKIRRMSSRHLKSNLCPGKLNETLLKSFEEYVKLNINWDALGGRNVTNQKHIKLGFINARMLQSFDDEKKGEKKENVSICSFNGFNAQTTIENVFFSLSLWVFFSDSRRGWKNNVKMNEEKCNEKSIIVCSLLLIHRKMRFCFSSIRWNNYRLRCEKRFRVCFTFSHPSRRFHPLYVQKTNPYMTKLSFISYARLCCLLACFFDIQKVFFTCWFFFLKVLLEEKKTCKRENPKKLKALSCCFSLTTFCLWLWRNSTSDIIKMENHEIIDSTEGGKRVVKIEFPKTKAMKCWKSDGKPFICTINKFTGFIGNGKSLVALLQSKNINFNYAQQSMMIADIFGPLIITQNS